MYMSCYYAAVTNMGKTTWLLEDHATYNHILEDQMLKMMV